MQEDLYDNSKKLQRRTAQWRFAAFLVWTLIGIAVLLYFASGMLSILSIPVAIIVLTAIFVFTLKGSVNKLANRGVPRALAVAAGFLVLFAVVALLVVLLRPMFSVGGQIESAVSGFSGTIENLRSFADKLYTDHPYIFADPTLSSWIDSSLQSIGAAGEKALGSVAQSVISIGAFTVNALMVLMLSIVAAFWLLLEMPRMRGEISRLLGSKMGEDIEFLSDTFSRVIGGFIKGMLLQCLVIGVACGIVYAMVGFKNGMLFAFIVGMCNILPILGQWIAMVIIVVACLFSDGFTALVVILATLIIQRIVYMFIYPKIMADSVDVHPVMIIVVMMIGYALGSAMGGVGGSLVGILVSIPLAAVAKAMFVLVFERRTGRHLVAEDGVFFKGVPNSGDTPDPTHNATSPHPVAYAQKIAAKEKKSKPYILIDSKKRGKLKRVAKPADAPAESDEEESE